MGELGQHDFVDEVVIEVAAGDGGDGCIAFQRTRSNPFGGPSGGDGGKGGDVKLVTKSGLRTLLDLKFKRELRAPAGEDGRGKDQYGRGGKDIVAFVPQGTQVFDAKSGALLADLVDDEEEFVVARGGQGGRGNMHFATPYDRAPRKAENGEPGEELRIRLELRLFADVGLLGFPNVGKSTFISTVSRAKPKIANYPFTTLVPNLGVVSRGLDRSFVIADIPGIIEGASKGVGLGLNFLRHVERTSVLLHIVSPSGDPDRDAISDFSVLMKELSNYVEDQGLDRSLRSRPVIVGLSKLDLPEVREAEPVLRAHFEREGFPFYAFSSATGEGVKALLDRLEREVAQACEKDA